MAIRASNRFAVLGLASAGRRALKPPESCGSGSACKEASGAVGFKGRSKLGAMDLAPNALRS